MKFRNHIGSMKILAKILMCLALLVFGIIVATHDEPEWDTGDWSVADRALGFGMSDLVIHAEGVERNVLQNPSLLEYTHKMKCEGQGFGIGTYTVSETECFLYVYDLEGVLVMVIPYDITTDERKMLEKDPKRGEKWPKKTEKQSNSSSHQRLEDLPWEMYILLYGTKR